MLKEKKPPFWYSEIVTFKNEWRYYVADGKILCGKWYCGDEINTPDAPKLDIEIPKRYCGALDFGELISGELALIEAQHPFACGGYGNNLEDIDLYIEWVTKGWRYMKDVVKFLEILEAIYNTKKIEEENLTKATQVYFYHPSVVKILQESSDWVETNEDSKRRKKK